jgi:hypothetical protein
MRKISLFASRNFFKAQVLITVCQIILSYFAMLIAGMLDKEHIYLSSKLLIGSLLFFTVVAYVFRSNKRYDIIRLKYFLCGASLFIALCCYYSNNSNVRYNMYSNVGGTLTNPIEKTLSKSQQRKELRHMVKEIRKEMKATKDSTGQTLAIVGVVIGAIFLLSIVAALSCSIACGGSGALATLVALAGTFGVVWLMMWAIKKIQNKKSAPEVKEKVD